MQHLIAKPRPQQRLVGDLRVELPIARIHLVVGRAPRSHLREVIEERPPPIEVVQPDEHMAARRTKSAHTRRTAATQSSV